MAQLRIDGGYPLKGTIKVAGNKNAALPIIAATILTDEDCYLENMPDIRDIEIMKLLLMDFGKKIEKTLPNSYKISGNRYAPGCTVSFWIYWNLLPLRTQ